jgi:hypothetical protein
MSSRNNLITLRRLMLHLRPRRSLEIGLCFGASALALTASHKEYQALPAKQHVAIDPFQHTVWDDAGVLAIENAGLSEYFDFRGDFSHLELPRLLIDDASFDFVYVDGSHLIEDVFVDTYFVARLLAVGGVMVLDDSTDPHVKKVIRFLRANCSAGLEEVNLTAFRGDRGRDLKYRLARGLGKVQMTAFRRIGQIQRPWNAAFCSF